MSQRLSWLKMGVVFVLIILFFVIINGFFNENNNLLKERIFWQEKAESFQELYNQAQAENEVFRAELDTMEKGLSISGIKLQSADFLLGNGNNVTYSLLIEVENRSKQRSAGATGFIMFSILNRSGKNISTTAWRSFVLPALSPGETKVVKLSGKVLARSQAQIVIFANILGEPGLAKLRATLPKKPVAPPPPPKQERPGKVEPNQKESKEEKAGEDEPKREEKEPKEAEPAQGEAALEKTKSEKPPAAPSPSLPEPETDSETVG